MTVRIVSFMGTGKRFATTYRWENEEGVQTHTTAHFVSALAKWRQPAEVILLSTGAAQDAHGAAVEAAIREASPASSIRTHLIPDGGNRDDQLRQFDALQQALTPAADLEVLLDITHGFRAQPFLAAAGLAFQRATDPDAPAVRVVYGAFETGVSDRPDGVANVWELPAFADLVDWSHNLRTLLTTGRADEVVGSLKRDDRAVRRAWASGGKQGPPPNLNVLEKALGRFSEDLCTVRTGEILGDSGSANALIVAVAASRPAVERYLRPLVPLLGQIEEMARPLARGTLDGPEGHALLTALAALYLRLGRYAEAMTIVREAIVSSAAAPSERRPGAPGNAGKTDAGRGQAWTSRRRSAEGRVWRTFAQYRDMSNVRNTINHAGFQSSPLPAASVRTQTERWVSALRELGAPDTRLANLSGIPAAAWPAAQREAVARFADRIDDIDASEVQGDAAAEALAQRLPPQTVCAWITDPISAFALVRALQRRGVRCVCPAPDAAGGFAGVRDFPDFTGEAKTADEDDDGGS